MRDPRSPKQTDPRVAPRGPRGDLTDGVTTGVRARRRARGELVRPRLGRPIGYVAIVDDYEPYARAIAQFFEPNVDTIVAYSVAEALAILDRPGLVGAIVDVKLGAYDGTVSVAIPFKRRHPNADIRVVSGEYQEEPDRKAARAGCFFMAKDGGLGPIRELVPEWAKRARRFDEATEPIDHELERLFRAEILTFPQAEALRLATEGMSYAQIADEFGHSENAVTGMSARMTEQTGKSMREWAIELCEGTVRLPARKAKRSRFGSGSPPARRRPAGP